MTKVIYLCYQVFVKRFRVNVLVQKQFGCILAAMKIAWSFLMVLVTLVVSAQRQIAVTKIGSELLQADFFVGYDNFGFEYFIRDNVFFKKSDKAILEYKNLSLGKIAHADIQNPLLIVLFYENFNTAVLLDNQLNETQKINFSENTTPILAVAASMASGNRLWIFNNLSQKVGLFDYLKNDYRELTVPFPGKIVHYESDFNYFYWIDENTNRFACDIYGKVTAYGRSPGFEHFRIADNNWVLFINDEKIYAYEVKSDKRFLLPIEEKTFKSFHYQAQILSIFTTEGITNYKITLP